MESDSWGLGREGAWTNTGGVVVPTGPLILLRSAMVFLCLLVQVLRLEKANCSENSQKLTFAACHFFESSSKELQGSSA
jgi:hypothetical protein